MGEIYCLFSTRDFLPRYIGQTELRASGRYKQHITQALEKKSGQLYDWMRREWEDGFEVEWHTLQTDIIPIDLTMFEQYWISQFPKLLNQQYSEQIPTTISELGQQVVSCISSKNR